MTQKAPSAIDPDFNWREVARLMLISRTIDDIEETELHPQKKVIYQFSARGHDLAQILLGTLLNHPHDAAGAYYRSRPLLLSLGLSAADALASSMAKSGGFSDGRDIGVVCNLPSGRGATVLPMAGDVGSQYTPSAGWAQAILYHRNVLQEKAYEKAIAVVLGGEGSVASNGFWSSLTMAATLKLPLLFYIEDNGYAISVTSEKQTPGANIAANLKSFKNLTIIEGDGTAPGEAAQKLKNAVAQVRSGNGPVLIRLTVPRLCGHSGQDTQTYKSPQFIKSEQKRDPLPKLKKYLIPAVFSAKEWRDLEKEVEKTVKSAIEEALSRPDPDPNSARKYLFSETGADGQPEIQQAGGLAAEGIHLPAGTGTARPEPNRINMLTAIRRTLEKELEVNSRLLVFGEDVGPKGGVHAATIGLQEKFGEDRVFDTSLSEEGIIGRSTGMALAGLMPVAEIQFRKYTDPAKEQLNNCGMIRWRTANRFAAPMVVRVPGGFAKCGDPWHSKSDEVEWIHAFGWQVIMPSNAEDAVGLLRTVLRGNDPAIFFEHRNLLDGVWARRPYPGDDYMLPLGKANFISTGGDLTIVSWGAMVERCETAARETGISCDLIDLRTLSPWDKDAVIKSVNKTHRCLIVHEDTMTAGFGAEIAAVLAKEAFFELDAPVERLAPPDIPIPYNIPMMNAVLPAVEVIAEKIREIAAV